MDDARSAGAVSSVNELLLAERPVNKYGCTIFLSEMALPEASDKTLTFALKRGG
jgi:hypothetical protein